MISSNQIDFMMVFSFIFSFIGGYFVFVPEPLRPKNYYRNVVPSRISEILPYATLTVLVFMLMDLQTNISQFLGLNPSLNYDRYMLMLEGNKVIYFQSLATPILTYFCGVIYLLGFSFLLIFTFVILLRTNNFDALKEYVIAFALIYLTAYPFYIFFPIDVTGHVLPGMVPLLYQLSSPSIMQILNFCDPGLKNGFPSLHAALSVTATLFILLKTDLRRYKVFAVLMTIFILFAILYLGIHWITDMIGGIVLALIAYFVTTQISKKRFKDEDTHFYMR